MNLHWIKSTIERQGKPEPKFFAVSQQSLELESGFKKASRICSKGKQILLS
jgi:hypothetical protein